MRTKFTKGIRTSRATRACLGALALGATALAASPAHAADGPDAASMKVMLDTVWTVLAGALVFFMNAGFATLETGMIRSKNAVNVLAKNFVVAALAGVAFYLIGFGLMFADGNAFIGMGGFMLSGADNSPAMGEAYKGVFTSLNWTGIPLEAKFFFQVCFAMTAASIVSGAVAERIKFSAFVVFSLLLIGFVYGPTGHWIWGGGWLAQKGFWDFAGSTQVHCVGGFAALTGIMILGPRRGKYGKDGSVQPIPGHNISIATIGGFILWLGWIGFNGGSTMAADPGAIAHIVTATVMASLTGVCGALLATWLRSRAFDLTMMINGCLAGLVGITAGCAFVSTQSALLIGFVAGVLVVLAVPFFDRLKLDDPVGATSVHLVNGIWGTLAVGLFADAKFNATVGNGLLTGGGFKLLGAQALGVLAVGAYVTVVSAVFWLVIRKTIGLRVDEETEYQGLDITEMGMEAYPSDKQAVGAAREGLTVESGAMSPAPKRAEAV